MKILKPVKNLRDISDNAEEIVVYTVFFTMFFCLYVPLLVAWAVLPTVPMGPILAIGTVLGFIVGLTAGFFISSIYKDAELKKLSEKG